MVFGYSRGVVNDYGLLEMKEVTFAMEPAQLRLVGQFLIDMAREMEVGGFGKASHRHLTTTSPGWNKESSTAEVIVAHPGESRQKGDRPRTGN